MPAPGAATAIASVITAILLWPLIPKALKVPSTAQLHEAIIRMARTLRLEMIAEGVETADQMDFLRERRCDKVQEYYYSEPMPAERFGEMLVSQEDFA